MISRTITQLSLYDRSPGQLILKATPGQLTYYYAFYNTRLKYISSYSEVYYIVTSSPEYTDGSRSNFYI